MAHAGAGWLDREVRQAALRSSLHTETSQAPARSAVSLCTHVLWATACAAGALGHRPALPAFVWATGRLCQPLCRRNRAAGRACRLCGRSA